MAQQQKVGTVHTAVQRDGEIIRVIYHSTAVVEVTPDRITLNSGGWRTNTTKTRMNQASNQFGLGFQVFARKRAWFVGLADGTEFPFSDRMVVARG